MATEPKKAKGRGGVPTPPPPDAQLFTLEEVAYVLRVSVDSVRRLLKEGRLAHVPATVKGAAKRVLRETLDDFVRGAQTVARAGDEPPPQASRPRMSLVRAGWDGVDRLAPRPRRKAKAD